MGGSADKYDLPRTLSDSEGRAPLEPEFSDIPLGDMKSEKAAIRKKVLTRVFLNPISVLTGSGSAGTAVWMLVNGIAPWGLAMAFGMVAVGGSALLYEWIVNGPKYSKKEGEKLLAKYLAQQEQAVTSLVNACKRAKFKDGAREARDIDASYQRLRESTLSENPTDARVPGFLVMIEDAYQEGMGFIQQALSVHEALSSIDADGLQAEIEELESQLSEPKRGHVRGESLNLKLEAKRDKLKRYEDATEKLHYLMARASDAHSVLDGSALIDAEKSVATRETGAVSRLQIAMEAAREARESDLTGLTGHLDLDEIDRRLGSGTTPDES